MNELFLVTHREYITRVRTVSFVLTTILTPVLLSLMVLLPAYFVTKQKDDQQIKVGLIDPARYLQNAFTDSDFIIESLESKTQDEVKQIVLSNKYEGVIYHSHSDSAFTKIQYYFTKQPSISLVKQIRSAVEEVAIKEKMITYGINDVYTIINAAKEAVDYFRVGGNKIATYLAIRDKDRVRISLSAESPETKYSQDNVLSFLQTKPGITVESIE